MTLVRQTLAMIMPALAALGLAAAGPAAALTTIDFSGVIPQQTNLGPAITTGGLVFGLDGPLAEFGELAVWPGGQQVVPPIADNGTPNLIWTTADLAITRSGGGLFTLGSIDFGTSFGTPPGDTISYFLVLASGATRSGSIELGDSFQTLVFGQIVRAATFGAGSSYVAIDNVRFDNNDTAPVPETATWMLLTMGFAGAGLVLRRRRSPVATGVAG